METRANYALIGLITLAVVAVGFAFIYWIGRFDGSGQRREVEVMLPGDVTGLEVGGLVLFNGIEVGEVRSLRINPDDPNQVLTVAAVEATTPIKPDTTTRLGLNPLTGVAYIQFSGGSASAENILDRPEMQRLVGEPSAFADLIDTASSIAAEANAIVDRFNEFLETAQPSLQNSVLNVETFTRSLAENAQSIDDIVASVQTLSATVTSLSTRVEAVVAGAGIIVESIDPERVRSTLENVDTVTGRIADASASVQGIVTDVGEVTASLAAFADRLRATVDEVNLRVAAIDPVRITETVDNVAALSGQLGGVVARAEDVFAAVDPATLRSTLANLDTVIARVSNASVEFEGIFADTRQAAAELNTFTGGLNTTLSEVNDVIEAVDRAQIAAIVGNIRTASDGVAAASAQFSGVVARADSLVGHADTLIAAVDPERIASTLAGIDTVAANAGAASAEFRGLLADARGAATEFATLGGGLNDTLADVNAVIAAVDRERIAATVENIAAASARLDGVIADAGTAVDQAGALIAAVDPERVSSTLANIDTVAARVGAASANFEGIVANVDRVTGDLATFTGGLDTTLAEVNAVIAAVDRERIAATVENIAAASAQLGGIADQAGGVVSRVDGVIGRVDGLVAAVDPEQIRSTLTNIDLVAARAGAASANFQAIAANAEQVTTDLTTFSGGLTATLADVNAVIAAIDREQIVAIVGNVRTASEGVASVSAQLGGIAERANGVVGRVDGVVERVDGLVAAVDPEQIRSTLANIDLVAARAGTASANFETIIANAEQVTTDLATFSGGINATLVDVNEVIAAIDREQIAATVDGIAAASTRLSGIVDQTGGILTRADTVIAAIDPERVRSTLANIDLVAARAGAASDQFDAIVARAALAVDNANTFTEGLNASLVRVNEVIAAVDSQRIAAVVDDVAAITSRFRAASADIEGIVAEARAVVANVGSLAATLEARGGDIDLFITDARSIADRLNTASARFDSILATAETTLNAEEGGVFAEVNAAAQSLRRMAESFELRADEISTGLARFSGRGLDNLTALIADARTTLAEFERLATTLERQPSQIIFGGNSGVRDYNRR